MTLDYRVRTQTRRVSSPIDALALLVLFSGAFFTFDSNTRLPRSSLTMQPHALAQEQAYLLADTNNDGRLSNRESIEFARDLGVLAEGEQCSPQILKRHIRLAPPGAFERYVLAEEQTSSYAPIGK